jgi:hypothetical protein
MNEKIKFKLDEMWAALAAYQPRADAAGHGESWALMCSERTEVAAHAAYAAAYVAAQAAARAARAAASADYAARSIDYINKAQGETK